ncbi:MAG TPA: AAA family ATPase [Microvirga sp.]|nr:AAA family ATPase [Microvirga sp.]
MRLIDPRIASNADLDWRAEHGAPVPPLVQSSADFISGFVPPDYLWDGVLQRRYCYSLTGQTGGGKTAIALLLAASTSLGRPVAGRMLERGTVLYFAGENPDDVRMRWIAMGESMGFDPGAIDVLFIPGVFNLDEIEERVRTEITAYGGVALVILDTSAAYFFGDSENDNTQAGAHARRLRKLTLLPGGPTVLVLCHPVKNAASDNLLPRGGGAFLNEVDGNLTCARNGTTTAVHWQGKFRGPDFDPMPFELCSVTADSLKDSKGRNIPTVVAKALSDSEQRAKASQQRSDEDAVLLALLENENGLTYAAIAERLRWRTPKGAPQKSKAFRIVETLRSEKLVTKERGTPILSEKGKAAAKKVRYNHDTAGASYG